MHDVKHPDTMWPPLERYTMAHRCPSCGADAGQPCTRSRGEGFHVARQSRGARHFRRDIGRAPAPDDRLPLVSYDTLGDTLRRTA